MCNLARLSVWMRHCQLFGVPHLFCVNVRSWWYTHQNPVEMWWICLFQSLTVHACTAMCTCIQYTHTHTCMFKYGGTAYNHVVSHRFGSEVAVTSPFCHAQLQEATLLRDNNQWLLFFFYPSHFSLNNNPFLIQLVVLTWEAWYHSPWDRWENMQDIYSDSQYWISQQAAVPALADILHLCTVICPDYAGFSTLSTFITWPAHARYQEKSSPVLYFDLFPCCSFS